MRFLRFLEEARRNPELNPKISIDTALEKYKDRGDVYISFTDINKLGINPKTIYNTPAGIYSYPLKEVWENIKYNTIPFAGDRPYCIVFSISHPNLIELSDFTNSQLRDDIEKLKQLYPKEFISTREYTIETIKDFIQDQLTSISGYTLVDDFVIRTVRQTSIIIDINENSEDKNAIKADIHELYDHILKRFKIDDDGSNYLVFRVSDPYKAIMDFGGLANYGDSDIIAQAKTGTKIPTPGGQFWNLTRLLADRLAVKERRKSTWTWNVILRKLGYIGFTDRKGYGLIHNNEPVQAMFLSLEGIRILDSIPNKRYVNVDNVENLFKGMINKIKSIKNTKQLLDFCSQCYDKFKDVSEDKNNIKYIESLLNKFYDIINKNFVNSSNSDLYMIEKSLENLMLRPSKNRIFRTFYNYFKDSMEDISEDIDNVATYLAAKVDDKMPALKKPFKSFIYKSHISEGDFNQIKKLLEPFTYFSVTTLGTEVAKKLESGEF